MQRVREAQVVPVAQARAHFAVVSGLQMESMCGHGQAQQEPIVVNKCPPPPCLPLEWEAVWSEVESAYYFWHTPTGRTQWHTPEHTQWDRLTTDGEVSTEATEAATEETTEGATEAIAEGATEAGWRAQRIRQISNITGIEDAEAKSVLEEHAWHLEQSVRACIPKSDAKPDVKPDAKAQKAPIPRELLLKMRINSAPVLKPPLICIDLSEVSGQGAVAPASSAALPDPAPHEVGLYICSQHFTPQEPNTKGLLKMIHGEIVDVIRTECGLCFGRFLDDPTKEGYIPQAVLRASLRPGRPWQAGEHCQIQVSFEEPQDIAGFLTVAPGDVVSVLCPLTAACVWAYVERPADGQKGWVPEYVLGGGP